MGNKVLSEEKALKKLKITDFEEVDKDKIMNFASIVEDMEPAVVERAINKITDFNTIVIDGVIEYQETVNSIIKSTDKNHDSLIKMITDEHEQLLKMMDSNELSFEQKLTIVQRLDVLQDKLSERNKDIRRYRLKCLGLGIGGLFLVVGIGLAFTEVFNNNEA